MREKDKPMLKTAEQPSAQENQPNPDALRRLPTRERKGRNEKSTSQRRINKGRPRIV
jgi:hypothetical protein